MSRYFPNALAVSRRVLRALIAINWIYGAGILAILVGSLVAEEPVMRALGVRDADGRGILVRGMRFIMVAGILTVPIIYVVLTRLLAIVETVRAGDPFIARNADRLHTIAWSVLGLEVLHVVIAATAAAASSEAQPIDIEWSFSLTRWLAVLLLFVLARVFDHGARMRADLEGTV